MAKRSLRPRPPSQYVNQMEWDVDDDDFILARRYDVLQKFREYENRGDSGLIREMKGEDFTLQYVQENGLTSPMVFRDVAGLGMKLPSSDFSVSDVKRLVGPRREVDVMDTHTQKAVTMTMHQWAKYYETHPKKKILNIISLEFSCTKMADLVEPPSVVRQLDWVEGVWPREMKEAQTDPTNDMRKMMYPKVQKYCLMSVAKCFTDFHLDFGGTSVWYHLIRGEKLFLLIPPSPEAYEMFSIWQLSGEQEGTFFADLIEHAQVVRLMAGDTFIMPSGWIHAVYTPVDSLVFGGNFLHSFNIPHQLAVAEMETKMKVPTKFRYPFYGSIHWYMMVRYSKELERRGVVPVSDSTSCTEVPGKRGRPRWLKEVSVERVLVSQDGQTSPVHSCDGASASSTPPHGHEPHTPTPPRSHKPHTPTPPRSHKPHTSTPPHSHKPHTPTPSPLKHVQKCDSPSSTEAHISAFEIEGLQLLLEKIQDDQLFLSDAPPSLVNPLALVSQLLSQLKSTSIGAHTSPRPTGISLLQRAPKSKKRIGRHLKEAPPKKLSRVGSAGRSEYSCESEPKCSLSDNEGSQSEYPEESSLLVSISLVSLQEANDTSGGDPGAISDDCRPLMDLHSPSLNSDCSDCEQMGAESADYSDPPSPIASFSLQLPGTPTSPFTPPQLPPPTSSQCSLTSTASISTPSQCSLTPTASVSTPSQCSLTPTASVSTPSQCSLTPTASVSTPSQCSLTPTASVSTPTQCSLTPTAFVSTPSQPSLSSPQTDPLSVPSSQPSTSPLSLPTSSQPSLVTLKLPTAPPPPTNINHLLFPQEALSISTV